MYTRVDYNRRTICVPHVPLGTTRYIVNRCLSQMHSARGWSPCGTYAIVNVAQLPTADSGHWQVINLIPNGYTIRQLQARTINGDLRAHAHFNAHSHKLTWTRHSRRYLLLYFCCDNLNATAGYTTSAFNIEVEVDDNRDYSIFGRTQ